MGRHQELVAFLLQRNPDLVRRWGVAHLGSDVVHLGAVPLADSGEAVTKVARVHQQHVIAGLDEIDRRHVHGQGPRPGHYKRLSLGSEEYIAQTSQCFTENLHKLR